MSVVAFVNFNHVNLTNGSVYIRSSVGIQYHALLD